MLVSVLSYGFAVLLWLNYFPMKYAISLPVIAFVLIASGCGQKSDHAHEHAPIASADDLYDSVMLVHDEVMPKMNDIYKLKEELKKRMDGRLKLFFKAIIPKPVRQNVKQKLKKLIGD